MDVVDDEYSHCLLLAARGGSHGCYGEGCIAYVWREWPEPDKRSKVGLMLDGIVSSEKEWRERKR